MLNTYSYILNPLKLGVSLVTMAISLILAICEFWIARPWSAILFLVIFILFLFTALLNGQRITINEKGISCTRPLVKKHNFISWKDIKEVGVINTNLFSRAQSKSSSAYYIYFSPAIMNDKEYFHLALTWPPKNMITMQYTKERLCTIQLFWSSELQFYNAENAK